MEKKVTCYLHRIAWAELFGEDATFCIDRKGNRTVRLRNKKKASWKGDLPYFLADTLWFGKPPKGNPDNYIKLELSQNDTDTLSK